jgi:hypothetical protein
MNQGKSLATIAAELERQVAQRKDYVAPQGKVEAIVVEDGDRKEIKLDGFNGQALAIRPFGHKQLGDVLEIPAKYYEKMKVEQPELLAHNINTWFRSDPANKRMIRTLDGEVRAVLSPKYRPLDNFELASAVLPKLQALNVQVVSSELTETRMYIKAILPDLSDALPEGQVWGNGHNIIGDYRNNESGRIVAAIVISNSEVGNGSLRVEPSVFTTWCTNLAVMKQAAMRKYHVGRANETTDNWEVFTDATREKDNAAFFAKVGDVTAAAFNVDIFRAAVERIRKSTEDKIESEALPKVVEVAVKELKLPVGASTSILTFLAQGGDLSRWGLSSAITAASAKLEDYEVSTAFERAGGELLELPQKQWRAISQAA